MTSDTGREALIARLRTWPKPSGTFGAELDAAADMLAEDGRRIAELAAERETTRLLQVTGGVTDPIGTAIRQRNEAEARERALREAFVWVREGFRRHGAEAGLTGGGPCGCPRCENVRHAFATTSERPGTEPDDYSEESHAEQEFKMEIAEPQGTHPATLEALSYVPCGMGWAGCDSYTGGHVCTLVKGHTQARHRCDCGTTTKRRVAKPQEGERG